jgi:hypothetical protein
MIVSRRFLVLAVLLLGGALCEVRTANAEFKELMTNPRELKGYSESELNQFGKRLADEVYSVLSEVGTPTGNISAELPAGGEAAVKIAKSILSDQALIQNARFSHGITKKTYIPTDIDQFNISDVVVTLPAEDVLVASYRVSLPDRTDTVTGTVLSGDFLPRLTVLQWNESIQMWQVFSHADFDSPRAAVCGADTKRDYVKSSFKRDDVELGAAIITEFVDAMMGDYLKEHVLKGYQYVYASGEKKTQDGPVRTTIKRQVERLNLEAVRSGRLIAIRYDTPGVLELDSGDVEPEIKPRLFTFYQGEDGKWRFISAAVFSVTKKLSDHMNCISATQD